MTPTIDWRGPRRQCCPVCSRSDRDKTCGVTVDDRGGVAHCFRCGHKESMHEGPANTPERRQASRSAPVRHETLSDYGRELWAACMPLAGEALAYLQARACVIPPADGDLRWHPALKHPPSGLLVPALVALVTDALTGAPLTLHRTWIQANGNKAELDPPRMSLGGCRKQGGVVRLWPDEAVTLGLGVAEGIETCLSLAHAFTPVWACLDAGNLGAFPVLAGIESLLIGADHDDAGKAAAGACGARWAAAGREVAIVIPPRHKADINDVALEAA